MRRSNQSKVRVYDNNHRLLLFDRKGLKMEEKNVYILMRQNDDYVHTSLIEDIGYFNSYDDAFKYAEKHFKHKDIAALKISKEYININEHIDTAKHINEKRLDNLEKIVECQSTDLWKNIEKLHYSVQKLKWQPEIPHSIWYQIFSDTFLDYMLTIISWVLCYITWSTNLYVSILVGMIAIIKLVKIVYSTAFLYQHYSTIKRNFL